MRLPQPPGLPTIHDIHGWVVMPLAEQACGSGFLLQEIIGADESSATGGPWHDGDGEKARTHTMIDVVSTRAGA